MARTTVNEVRAVMPATTLTDVQIQASIDTATLVIDRVAAGCGSGLSDAELARAETYLAAHYCASTDKSLAVSEERFEGSSVKYSNSGKGTDILSTDFGVTANTLTGGCLQNISKRKARIYSMGAS